MLFFYEDDIPDCKQAHKMVGTKYIDRPIPTISLHDFDNRIDAIMSELVDAAENHGFFTIIDLVSSRESVDGIFNQSARFSN